MRLALCGLFALGCATSVYADENLSLHGYLRTGLGFSDGTSQPAFQAPGANSKYRLGNEPDTVLELALDYRYKPTADAPKDSYMQGYFMLTGYAPIGNSSKMTVGDPAQFYIKFSRYLGAFDLWAGRRWYQRKDIHMNDHFWLNPGQGSQAAAGLEDGEFGPGRFDLAVFAYEDADVASLPTPTTTGTLHSRLVDVRYRDIGLGSDLKLSLFGQYMQRPEDEILGFKKRDGGAGGAWLDYKAGMHTNTLAVIHRQGLAMVQGDFNPRPIRENSGTGYKISEAKMFEVNNSYVLESSAYSMQFALVHRQEETGVDGVKGDKVTWQSAGVRPIYYLGPFTSVALEVGHDLVDNEITDKKGSVTKETLAFQISREKNYYARPTIRLFVTNASWSDEFKGLVGGTAYNTETKGWSSGIQGEVWW